MFLFYAGCMYSWVYEVEVIYLKPFTSMFSHMCIFVCDRSIIHKLQYNTHNKLLCEAFCVMLWFIQCFHFNGTQLYCTRYTFLPYKLWDYWWPTTLSNSFHHVPIHIFFFFSSEPLETLICVKGCKWTIVCTRLYIRKNSPVTPHYNIRSR